MTRTYLTACIAVALTVAARPTDGGIILPGIQGAVYQDLDSSGLPSAGEGVAGATLRLYRDDGDGLFEPGSGDDQEGSDVVTGGDGLYSFPSLDPDARYFVQRASLTLGTTVLPAAVSGLLDPSAIRLLIDAFDSNQGVKGNPMTTVATSTLNDAQPNVLGNERDMYVHLLGGVGEVALRSNAFGVEVLQYDTTSGVVGQAIVTWDGIDSSAVPTPSLLLGDVDLTMGGTNEGLFLRLGIDATGASEILRLRLFDTSPTEFSEVSIPFPITDGTASGAAYIPFSDFVGPVSAAKVNAIQMLLGEGAKSIDAQFDSIGAVGPVVQDFVVVPEPAAMLMACLGLLSLVGGYRQRRR